MRLTGFIRPTLAVSTEISELNSPLRCARATLPTKRLIFEFIEQSVDLVQEDFDEGILHVLGALEKSDFGEISHAVSAMRGRLLAQKQRWQQAAESMTRALAILTVADSDEMLLREYEAFRALCQQQSKAVAAGGAVAAATI